MKTGRQVHSASHALAILCNLNNQKITNDFKILFTLYHTGLECNLFGMLNHIVLIVGLKKAMQVLDCRIVKSKENIKNLHIAITLDRDFIIAP